MSGNEYHGSVLGAGRNEMAAAAQAATMGGNARRPGGTRCGPELEIATSDEAREMLELKGGDKAGF